MINIWILWLTAISQLFIEDAAIIAYDCSQQVSNLTTFSLINVGECDIEMPAVNTTRVFVKLLQLNEFTNTHVRFCKVEIKRTARTCGAFSHSSDVFRGEVKFLDEITGEECKTMHRHRTHKFRDEMITNLKINATTMHPMTFAGKIDHAGNCEQAGTYMDPYGVYDKVVISGYLKITLKEYEASVNLNTNEIVLRSGTRCTLTQDQCIKDGYAFWDPVPPTTCEFNKYAELYAGEVNKVTGEGNAQRPVYIMESSQVTFAFTAVGTVNVCGYDLVRTQHPKLLFLEGLQTEYFRTVKDPSVNNLDIFAYVNSRVIANALSIAAAAPDLFAYQITKKSGYIGLVAGELVHLKKCVQVEVHRREESTCYQELPVMKTLLYYAIHRLPGGLTSGLFAPYAVSHTTLLRPSGVLS
ncbi:uncharacterized protein LOC116415870 [Nasonia vitripennis]|uniref:Uncharacterized protein n=1 Tax=Nasonia vitripennis TaxID=7425 RepID=A0A7M7PY47_NASVI|nr:uncharacterized protein LOC116415870 [Nasonia vitripennis]